MNFGPRPRRAGLIQLCASYYSYVESVYQGVVKTHIVGLVITLLLMAFFGLFILLPFIRTCRAEGKRIAELLSQVGACDALCPRERHQHATMATCWRWPCFTLPRIAWQPAKASRGSDAPAFTFLLIFLRQQLRARKHSPYAPLAPRPSPAPLSRGVLPLSLPLSQLLQNLNPKPPIPGPRLPYTLNPSPSLCLSRPQLYTLTTSLPQLPLHLDIEALVRKALTQGIGQ